MNDTGWQPIETAPKDRTPVLLWDLVVGVLVARWDGAAWPHYWDSETIPGQDELTHWRPLPPPPAATDAD